MCSLLSFEVDQFSDGVQYARKQTGSHKSRPEHKMVGGGGGGGGGAGVGKR